MSETLALATTLLVIAGSLAGVWFGWRLGRADRIDQWRRDLLIAAYADFVGACADFTLAVDHLQNADTDDARDRAWTDIKSSVLRFHNAWHRTLIVAPAEVRSVVNVIVGGLHVIAEECDKEPLDQQALSEQLDALAIARQGLSEKARASLGFGN